MEQEKKRVLVVDDDDAIRALVRTILLRQQLDVDTARDGQEALEKIDNDGYSVVLLDLMMPRLDGMGFLRLLEDRGDQHHPIIIVMTAATDGLIRQLTPKLVHGVIKKPFDVTELAHVVRECASLER